MNDPRFSRPERPTGEARMPRVVIYAFVALVALLSLRLVRRLAGSTTKSQAVGEVVPEGSRSSAPAPIATPPAPRTAVAPPEQPVPARPATALPTDPEAAPEPAAIVRRVSATWPARVLRVEGARMPPQTRCTLTAALEGDGVKIVATAMTLRCNGVDVYTAAPPVGGGRALGLTTVTEHAALTPRAFAYAVIHTGSPAAPGDAEIRSLDTTLTIRKDETAGPVLFEMRMAELSDPVVGAPLIASSAQLRAETEVSARGAPTAKVDLRGTVATVTGALPIEPGAPCLIGVSNVFQTIDSDQAQVTKCVVQVRCGGVTVIGRGQSFLGRCTDQGGRARTALDPDTTDNDGDPALDLDVGAGRVRVWDQNAGDAWQVTIALAREGRPQ